MASSKSQTPAQIFPGRGLGFLTLGASLHNVLTRLKSHPQAYPKIDLAYSSSHPLQKPVVINLPANGLRLRFDGPDQRLRLIEVLDFTKIPLMYKNYEVIKSSTTKPSDQNTSQQGPNFRHVYNRLFGPTYPGEYIPSTVRSSHGTYVLSYPGIAFSFPLQASSWSEQCDFVSLMSSSAAAPATSMAIFHGNSWLEARSTLFTRQPQYPRSTALVGKNRESVSDEIEESRIHGAGRIELVRRASPSFWITLSETTPQDLVAELGPPDAIYRKNDRRISIHGARAVGASAGHLRPAPPRADPTDVDHSSTNSPTDDSEGDNATDTSTDPSTLATECFYNYFHHGFDAFISHPTTSGPPFPGSESPEPSATGSSSQLTVTKVLLHGNIPGSYTFNRHRRSRWTIALNSSNGSLNSETPYHQISDRLSELWRGSYSTSNEEKSLQRGMVLNRGWGDSPESSIELLGGWEDSSGGKQRSVALGNDGGQGLGNTELFGFPGLLFEVLKNGAVSCLTVY